MKLGLFLSAQHPPDRSPAEAVREHLEQVAVARELGFSSVLCGQHFLSSPYQMFQTVPLLARVAAEAEGLTVGSGVLLLPLLNPLEVAEHAATLDAITGGRFVLGVGIGYRDVEFAGFGVEGSKPAIFERKLDVVRRLLAGEEVTAEGPGYRLEGARMTLRPAGRIPVWIAGNRDAAVRRAARLGDAWLLNPHTTLGELARQMELFRAERDAAGLPPVAEVPALREVCVAPTDEDAMRVAASHVQGKYAAYVQWGQSDVMPDGDTLRRAWEELTAGGRFIIGSPATCAELVGEHARQVGVDHLICRVQWPGMPQAAALRSMRLLAEEVLPATGLQLAAT